MKVGQLRNSEESLRNSTFSWFKISLGGVSMADSVNEGRDQKFLDIDRMVNEGLGGGMVTEDNGFIGDTTADTMNEPESIAASSAPETGTVQEKTGITLQRVQEIINSTHHIPVYYGARPVYLEQVHAHDGTVTVHDMERPEERFTVQANQLVEGES